MKIAVSVYSNRCFIAQSESYYGVGIDLDAFSLTASAGLQIYPGNVMLFGHGMKNLTHLYRHDVVLNGDNGNVLFGACLNGTGLKQSHFLTTAHHRYACIVNNTDNVSAMLTHIESDFTHSLFLR